jgi:RHS repeat-associated protein
VGLFCVVLPESSGEVVDLNEGPGAPGAEVAPGDFAFTSHEHDLERTLPNRGPVLASEFRVLMDPALKTFAYNAADEITSAAGVNYTYDGDGQRVEKSSGTLYWYGPGGEVLDETDLSGNLTSEYVYFNGRRIARRNASGSVYYYAGDFLGSARAMVTSSGAKCYDADFYPFGGERSVSNTCPQNYKFTGKERDTETGNDYFGARYYASNFGRFLSPDWSAIPAPVPYANLTNPQTLNLYAIVRDNPETFADLDGHGDGDHPCTIPNACNQTAPPSHTPPPGEDGQVQQKQKSGDGQPVPPPARQQNVGLNKDKFVNYMDQHAKNRSQHTCAAACRRGLEAGGLDTKGHPVDAGDYGPFLLKHGASVVPNKGYKPERGDVVVFDKNKAHPYGHIEGYNGKGWVSDFKQPSMIPYRSDVPSYTIYRFPDDQ